MPEGNLSYPKFEISIRFLDQLDLKLQIWGLSVSVGVSGARGLLGRCPFRFFSSAISSRGRVKKRALTSVFACFGFIVFNASLQNDRHVLDWGCRFFVIA